MPEVEKPATPAPKNLIDELIAEAVGDTTEETYEYTSSTGRKWTLRRIRSATELSRVITRGKNLEKRNNSNTPKTWHPYVPVDAATARGVAFLEACAVEPKLSTLDCLKLARHAGGYFLEVSGQILTEAFGGQANRDEEVLDDLGED